MGKIKLTQTELKHQKDSLKTFRRYLPTLKVKQQLLQKEWLRAKQQIDQCQQEIQTFWNATEPWVGCFAESFDFEPWVQVKKIQKRAETIAGVEIFQLVKIEVVLKPYDLYTTPLWVDQGCVSVVELINLQVRLSLARDGETKIGQELLRTSQRINLFEKVKIPQAQEQIKQISVYLDDQAAAAVGWARGAKKKRFALPLSEVS